ncbi:MAG: AAA family ATPase [Sulfurovum sp.]|nr:AAA family ATPase [Sulfurovum sp.]
MQEIKQQFKVEIANKKKQRTIAVLLLLVVILLTFNMLRDSDTLITHNQANALYAKNTITQVIVDGDFIRLLTEEEGYKIYKGAINKTAFYQKYPVQVRSDNTYLYDIFVLLLCILGFVFIYRMIQKNKREQQEQQEKRASMLKIEEASKIQTVEALTSTVTFADVAGIHDVKEELEEIIDFLREPKRYHDLGIRLPKGVLLVGPPGVGKTLISKAVAGEANVPFFYQSGASFVHIYVGMGAKRVSELFQKAKQMAPSIIFIDEIDAVGKSRGGMRNDEREATLNQLLTEMDGFEDSAGVIVIGATNKIEMLDDALLRAGRFDRRIHIDLPDLADRVKILELYLLNKPNMVNIEEVAQMTIGFSAAALDTLTNEAALYAMKAQGPMIETSDFEAVKDKVLLGKRKLRPLNQEEREIQAVYQGAKALVSTWLAVEFDKISMLNTQVLIQEQEIVSKSKLLSYIKVYLAGSLATKKRYKEQFTNGAKDIAQAKEILGKLVVEYAMGDNFLVTSKQEEIFLRESVSEVNTLLETLDEALTEVVAHLLKYENITEDECRDILRKIF